MYDNLYCSVSQGQYFAMINVIILKFGNLLWQKYQKWDIKNYLIFFTSGSQQIDCEYLNDRARWWGFRERPGVVDRAAGINTTPAD